MPSSATTIALSLLTASAALRSARALEFGRAVLTSSRTTIHLQHTYTNPIVIISDLPYNDSTPAIARITRVRPASFEAFIVEPSNEDNDHGPELVDYFVEEAGEHTFENGAKYECGSVSHSPGMFAQVQLSAGFPSAPVILSQIMTANDLTFAVTRVNAVNGQRFLIAAQAEESDADRLDHPSEKIGWCAFAPLSTAKVVVKATGADHTSSTSGVAFKHTFEQPPGLITKVMSYNGGNTVHYRTESVSKTGFAGFMQEEQAKDTEVDHLGEKVGFLAYELAPDEEDMCAAGVLSTAGVCCAASCGECGSCECADLPGGAALCCPSSIAESEIFCAAVSDVACLMPSYLKLHAEDSPEALNSGPGGEAAAGASGGGSCI